MMSYIRLHGGDVLPGTVQSQTEEYLFNGITLRTVHVVNPPLIIYAAFISVSADGIRFFVTPPNGPKPGDTDGMKTSTFLSRYHAQLAVNAAGFSPVDDIEGAPRSVYGLAVSSNKLYENSRTLPALVVYSNRSVVIGKPPFTNGRIMHAASGQYLILERGVTTGTNTDRHPRTAAGITVDGKTLILMVIDGRRDESKGATLYETALWLQSFGAYNALAFDGGGSTTMVVENTNGQPRVINTPVHGMAAGTERVVGNHFGVFAKPRTAGKK
ncbi:MAG: phosphodiester glycosidase family protein [Spirochaetes bacterium]|nr:phosphodiester glycosidase family protein [Spirochaetota bacterium]